MWAGDIIPTSMLVWGFSPSPHYNRLLSVIRMCSVWVYHISAPAASSITRLHHISLADKRKKHVACGMADTACLWSSQMFIRDDESKLQHCTHIINQLDEDRGLKSYSMIHSLLKKFEFVFKGNTVHTKMPVGLICVKYLLGCGWLVNLFLSVLFSPF